MNSLLTRSVLGAGALAVVATIAILANNSGNDQRATGTHTTPSALRPIELLHAQAFQVEQVFQYSWRAEQPFYQQGWLLVLGCNPEQLAVTQAAHPVLYVGEQIAERVNIGDESGRLVALVPGDVDLQDAPIFFGPAGLPEAIGHEQIVREVAVARQAGIVAPTAETIASATVAEPLHVADRYQLQLAAIDLVAEHSPQESDLIRSARAPLIK